MIRFLVGGFAIAFLLTTAAAQEKKQKDKPGAVWKRDSTDIDLSFQFGKNTLMLKAFNGENGAIVSCKTKTGKDGVITATVTKAVEKGTFPATPKVGFEFSFKWKVDGDKAVLSDLKGEGLDDAKAIIEGDYKK